MAVCGRSSVSTTMAASCSSSSSSLFSKAGEDSSRLLTECKTTVQGSCFLALRRHQRIVVGRPKLHLQRLVVAAAASKSRRAILCVRKQETVPLPTLTDPLGNPQHLSSFLQQPAGTKSMLNTNALERFEYLGDGVFRCYLPKLLLLKLEVAPIVDLFVSATHNDCCVEMLSCKFAGSQAVEEQNNHFSASMKNYLTWQSSTEEEPVLHVNVELNVALEVYTLPFTMLPLSAVETPGNVIMRAMLDRLVPVFIDHLFMDYQRWVEEGAASLDSDCMSSLESISTPRNTNGQKRLPVEVATST
ncbi:unnamed protein product [Sphagnum troendelagicum]|uniref:RNase III domain-containing protein n=1 Tax=Sphagnum troendelagicum TaxID=128251 RepID=A0ABP0TCM1_9BRYO